MKIIKKFNNTYLYGARINDGKVVREKIKLLEEQVQDGASLPTHLIQYEDGYKAICSPDMYPYSQEEADRTLADEIREAIQSNLAEIAALHEDNASLRSCLNELNSNEKD